MNRIFSIIICVVVAVFSAEADALIDNILKNNEEIKAARLSYESDALYLATTDNLPNPEVEMEILPKPFTSLEMVVSESLEWPGAYVMRRKAAKHRISSMEYLYKSRQVEVVANARRLYADLVYINLQIFRKKQLKEVVDSILETITTTELRSQYNVLDVSRLKLEAFDLSTSVSGLKVARQVAIDELTLINGNKPLLGVNLDNITFNFDIESVDTYISQYVESPDFLAMAQENIAAEYDVKAMRNQSFPEIKVRYKLVNEDNSSRHGVVFGLSLPIFSSRGRVKASKALVAAKSFDLQYRKSVQEMRVRSLYHSIVEMQHNIDKYSHILNYDEVMAYLNTALESKSITMVDYLSEYKFVVSSLETLDEMKNEYVQKYLELTKYQLF